MKKIALFSLMTTLGTVGMMATPAQAADLSTRQGRVDSCVAQVTEKNITDNASARKLCGCTVNEQMKITATQKSELDNWIKSGKDIHDNPTYQRIVAKLKACGNGIKFNQ